jgi:regulator of protease activity HflC (stomatin/prohibitin superfamily)
MASIRPFGSSAASRLLKPIVAAGALLVFVLLLASSCVTRIDAAHVGIRVKLAGSSRGVDDIPVVTGWVFYNRFTEELVEFPISVQNVVWTKDPHEGQPRDESITFSSQEGVNINADVGMAFHVEPSLAPHLYLRFRQADLLELAATYVRNAVREAFSSVTSRMPVQAIYGPEKARMLEQVRQRLSEQLGKDGIIIDQVTINGALRLPESVATAINRAMEATQLAIQAENKVRQVKAEAEQAITLAEGEASAARARAKGEADARLITSKAEARANLILRNSTTPTVLQYRALERWNGKLPVMNGGGAMPMLTFDAAKLGDEDKLVQLLGGEDDGVTSEVDATPPAKAPAKDQKASPARKE